MKLTRTCNEEVVGSRIERPFMHFSFDSNRYVKLFVCGGTMKNLFSILFACMVSVAPVQAQQAPDFSLRNLDNQEVTLSELKGSVVLVNFWATWCGPCQVEMPHLQRLYDELKDEGLVVLAISVDEARTASRVKPHIKSKGFTFPVLLDTSTEVVSQYNPQKTLPYSVLVDRNGVIQWRHNGYSPGDEAKLGAKIRELIAKE
jgi:peroxiredoxin